MLYKIHFELNSNISIVLLGVIFDNNGQVDLSDSTSVSKYQIIHHIIDTPYIKGVPNNKN